MFFTFEYTNGTIDVKQFSTPEEARRYAHLEGDHLLSYRRTDEKDIDEILATANSRGVSTGRSK